MIAVAVGVAVAAVGGVMTVAHIEGMLKGMMHCESLLWLQRSMWKCPFDWSEGCSYGQT